MDPIFLIIEDDRLERYYSIDQYLFQCYEQVAVYIISIGFKNPKLNIFEIGGGTGGTTLLILQRLTDGEGRSPQFTKYDFTDIFQFFLRKQPRNSARGAGKVQQT